MAPIKTELITLKKCDLFQNKLLIAIDSGCSLTKILFLNKKDQAQFLNKKENCITLEFSLFRNVDFEEALERIKLHAYLMEDDLYKIHITGTFARNNRDLIRTILNKEVVCIDELMSIKVGIEIALEHIGIENMIVKDAYVPDIEKVENEMIDKFIEVWKSKIESDINLSTTSTYYPCLFHIHSSLSGFIYFDEAKHPELFSMISEGGKNFLGLAKCILDTNDYNEIIHLASRGNKNNVDTQIKDILDGNIDSPYGKFPEEFPVFGFGKCMDLNKGREDFNKEDLALSLISMYMHQTLLFSMSVCMTKKISKVYLIGNIFISDIFQKELKEILNVFPNVVEFIILNFGYSGVLGAMVYE